MLSHSGRPKDFGNRAQNISCVSANCAEAVFMHIMQKFCPALCIVSAKISQLDGSLTGRVSALNWGKIIPDRYAND